MDLKLNISRRQRTGVLALLLVAIVLAAMLPFFRAGGEDAPLETPLMEIQDPEAAEPEDSKMRAYRTGAGGKVERYWEELDQSASTEDIYSMDDGGRDGPRKASEDDVYENITSGGRGSSGRQAAEQGRGGEPRPGEPDYREYRMRQYYENADATVRRGEAVKDSLRNATGLQPSAGLGGSPMTVIGDTLPIRRTSALSTLDEGDLQGFSSLGEDDTVPTDSQYPFECMFVRAERLRNGSRVSVRLLEDMVVGGTLIPKNTHLMAMCTIGGRLDLVISSVEMNSKIYQLGYEAYDTDGGKGIYCPDLDGGTRRSLQARGISSAGRLVGGKMARLASDAVQAGVSVAQTKAGEVTVTVPAGYRFFIVRKQR